MKIMICGRGAVATLYGLAFIKAGHHGEYFVRSGRAAEHGQQLEVNVLDCRKKARGVLVSETLRTTLHETLSEEYDFDLIIISIQHCNFANAAEYLSTRASKATILVFNNLWDEPAVVAAPLPKDQLAWGFHRGRSARRKTAGRLKQIRCCYSHRRSRDTNSKEVHFRNRAKMLDFLFRMGRQEHNHVGRL